MTATFLFAVGCIEDDVTVEITTRINRDGSCYRRIEYRYQRLDREKGSARQPLDPTRDPLRLSHRFPTGDPWTVQDDVGTDLHTVTVEAFLASPNLIGSDFWRAVSRRALPASNQVSFAMDETREQAILEYAEVFQDPASPLASLRVLARFLQKQDDNFARGFVRALGGREAVSRGDVKRVYRDRFAQPFAQAVAALSVRALYGPRERKQVEELMQRVTDSEKELTAALAALVPGVERDQIEGAVKTEMGEWGESLEKEMITAGVPLDFGISTHRLHFQATLVMPAPIVRANTCVEGDTATWHFDEEDLYGRGFEMWATSIVE